MKCRFSIALATLCATLLLSGHAEGAYDPVVSGSTNITFAKPFLGVLRSHGVKLQVRGGTLRGSRVTLPASGGEIDPKSGTGTVESAGTVVFVAGARKVILRNVVFQAKRAPLYAKVGGGQLKLASGARVADKRSGFGAEFSAAGMRLTAKLATRLNKKLRLGKTLSGGQLLGALRVEAQPSTVHLQQKGKMYLNVDPAFASKLNGLFVSLNPVAPAELSSGPTLSFPIGQESTLAPDASSGTVKLEGQVELLQLGSAQMFWREVWLEPVAAALLIESDVRPAPPHPGVAPQGPLLSLSAGGMTASDPSARSISIIGRPVTLGSAARLLNEAFADGKPTFAESETVGSISVTGAAE
ncbi:MAG TPA: hypothetical protein VFX35_03000 [Solirubrobacterales bacterium]|nr:hypothetical protein [Solirubrobacterales bacterium]